jgi:hypothetical protein
MSCNYRDIQSIVYQLENKTDYLLEVAGPIAGLNCNQGKFVRAQVERKNGIREYTWVIPAHTTVKFVFLPANGGLGEPEIDIEAFLNLGPHMPAPYVGHWSRSYKVPTDTGNMWQQDTWPRMFER